MKMSKIFRSKLNIKIILYLKNDLLLCDSFKLSRNINTFRKKTTAGGLTVWQHCWDRLSSLCLPVLSLFFGCRLRNRDGACPKLASVSSTRFQLQKMSIYIKNHVKLISRRVFSLTVRRHVKNVCFIRPFFRGALVLWMKRALGTLRLHWMTSNFCSFCKTNL